MRATFTPTDDTAAALDAWAAAHDEWNWRDVADGEWFFPFDRFLPIPLPENT